MLKLNCCGVGYFAGCARKQNRISLKEVLISQKINAVQL
jgi:hypothetical protein